MIIRYFLKRGGKNKEIGVVFFFLMYYRVCEGVSAKRTLGMTFSL